MDDKARVIAKEEIVLHKFDGPPEDGILLEAVFLTNGKITRHDHYDGDGNIVSVEV